MTCLTLYNEDEDIESKRGGTKRRLLFMRRKQKNNLRTGLLMAVGAVSAFFGARALMSWLRQRSDEALVSERLQERLEGAGFPGGPVTEPNFTPTGMSSRQEPGVPTADVISTGRTEVGENYQEPFQREGSMRSERNQEPIPTTGMGEQVMDRPRAKDRSLDKGMENMTETDQPVPVGSLVGPLIVHLLSFHNMINLLQMRRQTASESNTNTPDVRAGGADAVSSLDAQIPEFDHAAIVHGSLQERMMQMMDRTRDALQNTDYSEDQLFKIHDDLRTAICKVLDLLHKAGQDDVTGFEDVEKAYTCQ
jgi:hypothetical protein